MGNDDNKVQSTEKVTEEKTTTEREYVAPYGSDPVVPDEDRPHPPQPEPAEEPNGPILPGEAEPNKDE